MNHQGQVRASSGGGGRVRERPITLPAGSIQRIRAGLATVDVIPVNPTPKRLDTAPDGTWAWPGNDHRYDDLTMANQIRQAATLEAGDHLRVYQARGKSHLAITTLMLELVEIRPQLMPWLEDEDALAMGHTPADEAAGPLFATTPLDLLMREWCERHPDRPWDDAWVWRLQFRMVTP